MEQKHGLRQGEPLRRDKWLMPRVRPGCPLELGRGRVLFAGEAAGFLNPMGEGISSALESGHQAALAVSAHPEGPSGGDLPGDGLRTGGETGGSQGWASRSFCWIWTGRC